MRVKCFRAEHVAGQRAGQVACLRTSPVRPSRQQRRHSRHATGSTQAVVKTPSTQEPLKAPGSESNFTGLPKRKEDIPITSPSSTNKQMQEHLDLVRSDFQFIFKDIMDLDHFDENIFFSDPISKFTFFRGYHFNVQFLRYFLAPIYEVHEVRQAGEQEILVKWSWTMNFWWNRYNPFRSIWDPSLVFSGLTILGYNPRTGKWNKHIDAWDCLENQEFFSLEAFAFTLRQMFQVAKPPNRYTPEFMILKKYKDWEIRKYKPFLVAEATAQPGEGGAKAAEQALREYLEGANDRNQEIDRTTPLFRDSDGKLFFMLPGNQVGERAPTPDNKAVTIREHPGGWYGAGICGGNPSETQTAREVRFVRACANQEGSRPLDDDSWTFARCNERNWPKGSFRRNDILVPLDEASIDLWRGVDWDYVKRIVAKRV